MINQEFTWFVVAIPVSLIAGIATFYVASTIFDASKAEIEETTIPGTQISHTEDLALQTKERVDTIIAESVEDLAMP
ncbi:MAG: hypothetical protein ACE5KA_07530 [Nitrososphaerales archaeon]